MAVALALTVHDPQGRLSHQIERVSPALHAVFPSVAVRATAATELRTLDALRSAGARVDQESCNTGRERIGESRRAAVVSVLQSPCTHVFYCDCDRVLHWAERYPVELAAVARGIQEHDFTVLGRTPRAFASHPRVQRDTEEIINFVFLRVSGHSWDVGAGARGLSRRAAEAIVAGCPDPEMSNDVSWPLFLLHTGGFSLGHLETEGLEFETADRYSREILDAGGYDAWLEQLDSDPRRWLHRLEVARVEIEGMLPFASSCFKAGA